MLHPNFLSSVTIDFILSDSLNLNSSAPEIVDSPSANVHANEVGSHFGVSLGGSPAAH